MKIRLEVEVPRPRWLERLPTWGTRIGLVTVAALAAAVPVAWASDRFADVPSDHPFHDPVNALAGAGITTGCATNAYCPNEPVTRGAMAAFLNRGLGRVAMRVVGDAPDLAADSTVWNDLVTETIAVGGVGGTQIVSVDAWYRVDTLGTVSGPCEFGARIVQDSLSASPEAMVDVDGSDGDVDTSVHVSYAFRTTSGPHTYTLQAMRWNYGRCTTSSTAFHIRHAVIRLQTFPFDQNGGTSTLRAPATEASAESASGARR